MLAAIALPIFGAVEFVSQGQSWRTPAECVATALIFVSLAAWVRVNRAALGQVGWCACAGQSVAVRIVHSARVMAPVDPVGATPLPVSTGGKADTAREENSEWLVASDRP